MKDLNDIFPKIIKLFFSAVEKPVIIAVLSVLLFYQSFAQKTETKMPVQQADQFLISQFKQKDLVFLGELHRIKEQVEFVNDMIPVLHKNGIRILFSEFANYRDTKKIDSLITAKTFNYKLAERIQYENSWDWGYKEYVDLYYAAWKTNQNLLPNEKPFRIVGLENEDNGSYDPEQFWAHIIDSISIKKGEKAIVYCGLHHSFTHYHQPYLVNDTLKGFVTTRAGNILYRKYPDKTITVLMHGPWYGNSYSTNVLPCNGMIDSLIHSFPQETKETGFSTSDSFFANFSLKYSLYNKGYENAMLKDLCQGYIVVKPVCELHPVTAIPDFINKSNIDETIKKAELGNLSPEAFNDSITSWLYEYSTKNLQMLQKKYCR